MEGGDYIVEKDCKEVREDCVECSDSFGCPIRHIVAICFTACSGCERNRQVVEGERFAEHTDLTH